MLTEQFNDLQTKRIALEEKIDVVRDQLRDSSLVLHLVAVYGETLSCIIYIRIM